MVEGTEGSHHKEGSKKMSKDSTVCAGIDTGKYKLDVVIDASADRLQVDNSREGYRSLSAWLRQREVEQDQRDVRLVVEDSGGFGRVDGVADDDPLAQLRQELRQRVLDQRVIVDHKNLRLLNNYHNYQCNNYQSSRQSRQDTRF